MAPRAAMSAQARAWLDANSGPAPAEPDDTPIAEQRAAVRAMYLPAGEAAAKRHGVRTRDVIHAGVPCLEITPPETSAPETSARESSAPVPNTPDQTILYLFGGGFCFGSPEEDMTIIAALATGTGATVIAPRYRLAPEHPFPAGLDDCTAVLRALLGDPGRIVTLAGESAGGNLALAATLRLMEEGAPLPRALALMSPAAALDDLGDSYEMDRDPTLSRDRLDSGHALYAPGVDLTDPGISPIYGTITADFPPLLMTSGTRDMLLSGCLRFARVLREAGGTVDLRVWDGMWHVFEFYPDLPEADASLAELAQFLRQHLDPET